MSLDTTKPVSKITYNGVEFVKVGSENSSSSEIVDGSITTVTGTTIGSATTIRDNAFSGLEITTVEIPASVTTIGDSAFADNNINTLTISEGVQTIGANAFANNNITALTIPASITTIGDSAFAGCDSLTEITMKGTTPPIIGENALPDSVTSIYVEYGCYNDYVSSWSAYADKIVRGPAKPSTITVTVNNYLDELVSGASVTITGNGQTYTGTTDNVGEFTQGDLQPATYTISVADLEGFKTPSASEVVVEEDTQNSVTITYLEKPAFVISRTFSENTPYAIEAVSDEIASNGYTSSQVKEIYGWDLENDTIDITLTNGWVINMGILGYNHDVLSSDHVSKVGISLGMTHCLPTLYPMNSTRTNAGGYASSKMKTETMPMLKALLPQEWQDVIKLVDKKSANGGSTNYSETLTLSEDLFFLSELEVYGTVSDNTMSQGENEGNQYEYWVDKTAIDKIKKYDSDSDGVLDTNYYWWLRSSYNTFGFRAPHLTAGTPSFEWAEAPNGVSFAFCI